MQDKTYKAVILGASGAVGREVVQQLCESNKWTKVVVIVRRQLEQWEQYKQSGKLEVIQHDNLDIIEDASKFNQFQNFDTFFSLLGTRVKVGDELFKKVDYQYPIWGANIALANKIPHHSLLTSSGANQKSWFLYMKTKGQVEEAVKLQKLPQLSIFRPGALLDRDNDDRVGEKILRYIPFVPKITTKELAKSMIYEAELAHQNQWQGNRTYEHSTIEKQNYNEKK